MQDVARGERENRANREREEKAKHIVADRKKKKQQLGYNSHPIELSQPGITSSNYSFLSGQNIAIAKVLFEKRKLRGTKISIVHVRRGRKKICRLEWQISVADCVEHRY